MEEVQSAIIEQSDDENEMNLINITKIRKKTQVIDSDSENEETLDKVDVRENVDENTEIPTFDEDSVTKKQRIIVMLDSDNEEENVGVNKESILDTINEENRNLNDNKLNDNSYEEDVVDEEEVTPHNKSFPDEATAVEAVVYTTNSKGELIKEKTLIKESLLNLCDSDSEAEPSEEPNNDVFDCTDMDTVEPKPYKKKYKKKDAEKSQKMTAKEAAQQRSEIYAESQRMLRESNISLPYHKPKSYTIKEFLQKRSRLSSVLPLIPKASPPVAIKMSKDQLKEVSKKFDQRIKEVEEFYKSESEDEENDDASKEIKNWLYILVDNAVDSVEEKIEKCVEEFIENEVNETEEHNKSAENSKGHESMEYDFNLDDVNEHENKKKVNISELIKDRLKIQPKLSGTPDDIIDLEDGVTRISGIKQLVDKFFHHTAKKPSHKQKVQLNVVEVDSHGEIMQETVSMNIDDEEEEPPLVETPGAKLQKLREDLQLQMAQKRLELWKQKHEQGDCYVAEKKADFEEYPGEKDILDDEEEEFEMTESEDEEEDDDEEEYDMKPEKRKPKSAFVEEEADEDEDVEDDDDGEEVPEKRTTEIGDETDEVDEDAADDEVSENNDVIEEAEREDLQSPKKKVLRRIIKPFSADSDDDDDEQESQVNESAKIIKYYTTDEDEIIPPNLPRVGKTPQRTQLDKSKSEFEFLTPVTYLTGLQNLNDSKFLENSPVSPFQSPTQSTESQETNSQSSQVQKNLFPENISQTQNSQENLEDLAQLCTGKFPDTQEEKSQEQELEDELPSTQDLLNVCSGDFSTGVTVTGAKIDKEVAPVTAKPILHVQTNSETEIKHLDEEQDLIISQLLDEDELERFKKKFESPVNPIIRKSFILDDVEEVNATGMINSDDENEELELKMKKRKRIVFSDDEEDEDVDDDGDEAEEEIDLHDSDDEEQQLENEVKAQESHKYKISDFLDKEAELSESEWGSDDEDERGLDELEVEQGDEEKFNENKMRTEIERIHMRQLLDDDNREVKILQELLLEDGELHGTGRKRQFKWKTLDSANSGEFDKRDDDDIFLDEEENEAEFRKMRHKREMFLKEKSKTDDVDSILSDSQILKIGNTSFKSKSASQNNTPNNKPTEVCKEPFNLLNKRGSFLSRNDQVLQRLAEYNKVTTNVGSTSKKCFVFQTVGSDTTIQDNNNKRKANDGTPNAIKKLRLNDLSPAVGEKNKGKGSRAKKLFGNW